MGAALSRSADGPASPAELTITLQPAGPPGAAAGSLAALAETLGGIPRVLLRDSEGGSGFDPVIQPGSPEMIGLADRSAHLQLFGEIARGGMGAVLKGRDVDIGRDLAVKVLLEKHRDNPDLARRFIEEAQIAGQLQHPGVVPIYELGIFADCRPYFAMKLVKGRTFAAILAERADSAEGLMGLLGTMLQVGQTVAFAHARGVIHRDLKPSNVMVGSFGEVQVMDWGLAKVLPRGGAIDDAGAGRDGGGETVIATARSGADSDHSRAGSVLGTPAYMAPEQARGEVDRVDERADVFALGSMLCEVLTGQPAFTGHTSTEVQRKAARGEMSDAFARLDACGADADLVALAKDCLAREAEDRPRQASAVTERMTAYLAGVQERLRTAEIARAAESARAEEAVVRAQAERRARRFQVSLAASLLVFTTAGGLTFTYWLQQRQRREARFNQVLAEAKALREKAGRQPGEPAAWRDALAALERAQGQGPEDRIEDLRREIQAGLDEAERDTRLRQQLVEIRANREDVGGEGTDAAYANAYRDAGLDVDVLEPAEFARRLRRQSETAVIELCAFLDDWSAVRREARRAPETWRRSLEAARRADPEPYRDRLRAILVAEDRKPQAEVLKSLAAAPEAAELPAATVILLGNTLADIGQAEAAARLLRQAAGRYPSDVWVNYALAAALDKLRPAAREDAVRYYTAARALRPETAHKLAHLLERMGRLVEAAVVFRDLVDRRPGNDRHQACLGRHLLKRSRSAEAAPILERAVATAREVISCKSTDAVAHFNLGSALLAQGKAAEAAAEYREAIRRRPDYAAAHNDLGIALRDLGMAAEAVAELREAIRLHPDDAESHTNLGITLADQGNMAEAIVEHGHAIRLQPDLADAHANLGIALRAQGKVAQAIDEYREAIRLEPDNIVGHINLGSIYCDVNHDYKVAEAEFREAIRLQPDLTNAHFDLGIALRAQGKLADAIAEFREAVRLKPDVANAHHSLGSTLADHGKVAEAIAEFREAIRLKPDLTGPRNDLGTILCDVTHDYVGAEAEFREAIRLKPNDAVPHSNLGRDLSAQGRLAEAVAAFREAVRLEPDFVEAHAAMGAILANHGKRDEAIAELRTAIRLEPKDALAHFNLGTVLRSQGDYVGALAMLRRAHELGSKQPGWSYPSAQWVANAEHMVALAPRLTALLKGDDHPKDVAERLALAQMCYETQRDAAAARFWAEALAADPMLADDRQALLRYNAACAAALAGTGHGSDDPKPNDGDRTKLRDKALDWLKAERAAWEKVLDSADANARSAVFESLRHWQADPDLADVRDPNALHKLPESERTAWRVLWADVDRLLGKAGKSP
jgi:serine/threonine-protein kinase